MIEQKVIIHLTDENYNEIGTLTVSSLDYRGNFEFDKNGQANDSSQEEKKNGNRRFITDEELSQGEETDQLAKVFMEGGESTVNYMP